MGNVFDAPSAFGTGARTAVLEHRGHDLPCLLCGHPVHRYLPCSPTCDCDPITMLPDTLA